MPWWGLRVQAGSGDAAEGDVVGHLGGNPGGKGTDLLVDVHLEGLALPASQLLDGHGVYPVEVESHGPAGPEGMAADIGGLVAKFGVELDGAGPVLDCLVDGIGGDGAPVGVEWVAVAADGQVLGAIVVGHNVVDASGQGLDGAHVGAEGFLVDALSFDPILLVGELEGGVVGSAQRGKW